MSGTRRTVPARPSLTVGSTRTPTLAMPSAFSWPVLVPYALRAPAPVNLGVSCHSEITMKHSFLIFVVATLCWQSAMALPSEKSIANYPFVASSERSAQIRNGYLQVIPGMSSKEVAAILGEPDEVRPLYEPIIKQRKVIGYTQWYVLKRRVASGGVNEMQESLVRVSFGLNHRVTKVDAWGL